MTDQHDSAEAQFQRAKSQAGLKQVGPEVEAICKKLIEDLRSTDQRRWDEMNSDARRRLLAESGGTLDDQLPPGAPNYRKLTEDEVDRLLEGCQPPQGANRKRVRELCARSAKLSNNVKLVTVEPARDHADRPIVTVLLKDIITTKEIPVVFASDEFGSDMIVMARLEQKWSDSLHAEQ